MAFPAHGARLQGWATPWPIVAEAEERFAGRRGFELDAAAEPWSAKAPLYFTRAEDALERPWVLAPPARVRLHAVERNLALGGTREPRWGAQDHAVWLNPPYEDLGPWVAKAAAEVLEHHHCRLACLLIPARVSSPWWHEIVRPKAWHVELLRGRVSFTPPPGADSKAPFEHSAIVVFARTMEG